jgi:hypothetical protein
MPALKNKTILIVSPQAWGNMFISKHHYALELARQGNTVYFLNPPGEGNPDSRKVEIHPSGILQGLFFITHSLWFPYRLKFHALPLFHFLMSFHVKRITKKIGRPIDIVWSFDLGNLYPFRLFNDCPLKIFHPVDEPLNPAAINSGAGADIVFSVTTEILEKYHGLPGHFINHGVSENFLFDDAGTNDGTAVRIGFSGNLLRNDVDREIFLQIIRENPDIYFECWGSYRDNQSNIGGASDVDTREFITELLQQSNVILHGPVPTDRLAKEIRNMDGFLICYDIKKDQSGGTNYHKIMEYISTGKVIISNNITTYATQPDLVQMVSSREHNRDLPMLFKTIMSRLDHFNAPEIIRKRILFAKDNTYRRQIERIEGILDQSLLSK